MSGLERRPWKEDPGSWLELEHQKLSDLFGTVDEPDLTILLTWKPEDLLSPQTWLSCVCCKVTTRAAHYR
jgi:hypothetical protein